MITRSRVIALASILGLLMMGAPGLAGAGDLEDDAEAALQALYESTPEAKVLGASARGILVFPNIVKAGFMVGAQYGQGALLEGDHMTPTRPRGWLRDTEVPGFVRVNFASREVSSVDGQRTSPIAKVDRADGRLMFQGVQNARVWGAVIEEQSGLLGATVSEPDGAIVISGSCIAP